jgi:3-hydroxy acid dehydrogenase/malonic semialdehyde reductase
MELSNKIILITGATSGIGEACAYLFAKHGARLIICGRREERLNAIKEKLIKEYQTSVYILNFDVTQREAINKALQSLPADFKNIDILINNAGGALGLERLDDAHVEDWEGMIDMNVKGLLYLIRAILPDMYARNTGHIVNIGSTASHNVYPGGSVYCATKHAVHAISKALNLEAIGTAVRTTEIDPGMVETEFSLVRFKGDAEKAHALYQNFKPLVAADVADAIFYAITRPEHVNIAQMVLYSREQPGRIPD